MNIEERAEKAAQLKMSGKLNCAQSVVTALSDQCDLSEEQLQMISAGFCAGMGTLQATCGALIGAGMVAGLKTKGQGTLACTRMMIKEFEKKCGAVTCKDLKAKQADGSPLCPCEDCVRNAVRVYGEVFSTNI
jgi:C_GCAxxG_C_C family probable redox protein